MIKTENKIQQEIVLHINNKYCLKHHKPRFLLFSVPNDSINAIETKRKVNTGLLRGVSDLILVMPGKLLFLEVKTDTGYQSESQREFQKRVEELGFSYHVVRSIEDVEVLINNLFSFSS